MAGLVVLINSVSDVIRPIYFCVKPNQSFISLLGKYDSLAEYRAQKKRKLVGVNISVQLSLS
jgi:hypothetical protein